MHILDKCYHAYLRNLSLEIGESWIIDWLDRSVLENQNMHFFIAYGFIVHCLPNSSKVIKEKKS